MTIYYNLHEIDCMLDRAVNENSVEVTAEQLGLDPRAGYNLRVSDDAIIVKKYADGRLQYYGGFEYVDKDHRMEYGEWVFYLSDSPRVADHLEMYHDAMQSEEV